MLIFSLLRMTLNSNNNEKHHDIKRDCGRKEKYLYFKTFKGTFLLFFKHGAHIFLLQWPCKL